MTRRRSGLFAALLVLALGASACDPDVPAGSATSLHNPIFGGTLDTTNEAVMALIQQVGNAAMVNASACTGTTIAKVGASGILLTAAHCVVANDGRGRVALPLKLAAIGELYVLPGADWVKSADARSFYAVAQVAIHPGYDGDVDSPFDVALVRYLGATAATPVIPAVTLAEDTLAVNSTITLVGYGKTATDAMNSQRRKVDRQISMLSSRQFAYSQTDLRGACEGDSGGPALFQTPAGGRVVGVTSFGDTTCRTAGVSVRVSSVASFIQSFMTGAPAVLSCEDCTTAAVGPGNACFAQGATCSDPATPCGRYLDCVGPCQTAACAAQCRTANSAGATAYGALAMCQCGGACTAPCKQDPVCMSFGGAPPPPSAACGGLTDSRSACMSCLTNSCCAEAAACGADPNCAACQRQSSAGCRFLAPFINLNSCLATCAGAPCAAPGAPNPGPTPDGGATPDPGPGPPDDAGVPRAGPADTGEGCGCAAAPTAAPALPWPASALGAMATILLFLPLRLRKRRRR